MESALLFLSPFARLDTESKILGPLLIVFQIGEQALIRQISGREFSQS